MSPDSWKLRENLLLCCVIYVPCSIILTWPGVEHLLIQIFVLGPHSPSSALTCQHEFQGQLEWGSWNAAYRNLWEVCSLCLSPSYCSGWPQHLGSRRPRCGHCHLRGLRVENGVVFLVMSTFYWLISGEGLIAIGSRTYLQNRRSLISPLVCPLHNHQSWCLVKY